MPETKVNKTILVIVGAVLCIAGAIFSVYEMGTSLEALLLFYLICTLVAMSLIDQATMEIPNFFHLLIIIASIASIWFGASHVSLKSRIIGFFVISIPMYLITCLTDGFGGGDIKLMAVTGTLLGVKGIVCAFFVGIFSAALYCIYVIIYALIAILRKKSDSFKDGMQMAMKMQFAFGPYLAIGIVVAYLYADQLISFYLGMFLK